VRGPLNDQLMQFPNLVKITKPSRRRSSNHFNKSARRRDHGNVASGYTLGQALETIDATGETELPAGTITDLDGQARELREAGGQLYRDLRAWRWCSSTWCWQRSSRALVSPVIMFTCPWQ